MHGLKLYVSICIIPIGSILCLWRENTTLGRSRVGKFWRIQKLRLFKKLEFWDIFISRRAYKEFFMNLILVFLEFFGNSRLPTLFWSWSGRRCCCSNGYAWENIALRVIYYIYPRPIQIFKTSKLDRFDIKMHFWRWLLPSALVICIHTLFSESILTVLFQFPAEKCLA